MGGNEQLPVELIRKKLLSETPAVRQRGVQMLIDAARSAKGAKNIAPLLALVNTSPIRKTPDGKPVRVEFTGEDRMVRRTVTGVLENMSAMDRQKAQHILAQGLTASAGNIEGDH